MNGAVDYFSISARLPEARGTFIDVSELIRLWEGPRRVLLVARRPSGQSVASALTSASARELGRYGAHRLYSNR